MKNWGPFLAVTAFRFGPVRESYAAEKYHNTRNVGVIGIALFNEEGSDPWTNEDVRRRLKANPFSGRFATPPNGVALPLPLCIVREPCRNFSSRPTAAR